jgi:hypothetical protein
LEKVYADIKHFVFKPDVVLNKGPSAFHPHPNLRMTSILENVVSDSDVSVGKPVEITKHGRKRSERGW